MRSHTAVRYADADTTDTIIAQPLIAPSPVTSLQFEREADGAATTRVRRRVATIHVSEARRHPPSSLFAAVAREIAGLGPEAQIDAVVLRGRRVFAPGELALSEADGEIQQAVGAVLGCAWPVVAFVEDAATGAGLELALACTGRVAREDAVFSFPGVGCGRVPIHGATRRLPLLVGYPDAARMLVFGEVVSAREALRIGLVDALEPEGAECLASFRPAGGAVRCRRILAQPERTAAEAVLLGVGMRLKRERPNEATPLAVLRAMEAAIEGSEPRALAEARRFDAKLSQTDEPCALMHATLGEQSLRDLASREARVAALAARLFWPLLREAIHLLDEGSTPAQVDRCLTAYGFALGPFTRSDDLGLAAVLGTSADDGGPVWRTYSPTLDLMLDAGRLGGAGGVGWFQPSDAEQAGGGGATPRRFDPLVERLLDGSAVSQRLQRRALPDEMVTRRCLYAAINGTAALAEAEPGLDAAVLDAIWTTRLGFPRWRGGPLFQAALAGQLAVVAELDAAHRRRDTAGAPSAAIARLTHGLC